MLTDVILYIVSINVDNNMEKLVDIHGLKVENNQGCTRLTIICSEQVPCGLVLEYNDNYQINSNIDIATL